MRVKGLLTTAWLAVSLSSVLGSVLRSGDVAPGITSRAASQDSAPLLRAASQDDIRKAREMVDKAMEEAAKLNEARMAHPFRNQYVEPADLHYPYQRSFWAFFGPFD